MKKITLIALAAASLLIYSCKPKAGSTESDKKDSLAVAEKTSPTTATPAGQATNAPKTYTVTFTPDTAALGKKKEAAVKIIPVSATDLSDPDGKSQGIELVFKLSLTNKEKIGGNSIMISPSDFRLMLDNNTSISQTEGSYFSVQPESTKESESNVTYRIPAGAKPKTLNLFYDETRASVQVELK